MLAMASYHCKAGAKHFAHSCKTTQSYSLRVRPFKVKDS